jgi:hypothetical protein
LNVEVWDTKRRRGRGGEHGDGREPNLDSEGVWRADIKIGMDRGRADGNVLV